MDFDIYQEIAKGTAIYPGKGTLEARSYLALGLNGEAGEVAEIIKREIRDQGSLSGLSAELGDVLWYVSELARQSGISLSFIARQNLDKLARRNAEGKLGGSGSDR